MSNTILAVIELENYPELVAQRAAWLARSVGADLKLMLCDSHAGPLHDSFIVIAEAEALAEELRNMDLRSLEELRDLVQEDDLTVTTMYSQRYPLTEYVLDTADELDPLYVVKGTHYHRPSERASMSDVDWQLIRKLRNPLWFVKPNDMSATPTVVAAVDPAHANDKPATLDQGIIEQAKRFTMEAGSRLLLLHTYQRLTEIGRRAMWTIKPIKLPIDELDEKIRTEHRAMLDNLASANGIREENVHQLPGRPNEVLPTFSRTHGADLVIMGALSRSSVKRRLVGDTAQRTLDHIECDVLIVHPDDEEASGQQAA